MITQIIYPRLSAAPHRISKAHPDGHICPLTPSYAKGIPTEVDFLCSSPGTIWLLIPNTKWSIKFWTSTSVPQCLLCDHSLSVAIDRSLASLHLGWTYMACCLFCIKTIVDFTARALPVQTSCPSTWAQWPTSQSWKGNSQDMVANTIPWCCLIVLLVKDLLPYNMEVHFSHHGLQLLMDVSSILLS